MRPLSDQITEAMRAQDRDACRRKLDRLREALREVSDAWTRYIEDETFDAVDMGEVIGRARGLL